MQSARSTKCTRQQVTNRDSGCRYSLNKKDKTVTSLVRQNKHSHSLIPVQQVEYLWFGVTKKIESY